MQLINSENSIGPYTKVLPPKQNKRKTNKQNNTKSQSYTTICLYGSIDRNVQGPTKTRATIFSSCHRIIIYTFLLS